MAKRRATGVLDAAALHDLVNPEKPKKAKKKKKKKARVEIEDEDEPAAPLKAKKKKSKKARVVEEAAPPAAPVYPNGRRYTVSIALPGSIIANSQTVELQTYLAGQIARALTVFEIDEIVIFDDQSASGQEARGGPPPKRVAGRDRNFNPNVFLAHVLQYLETPQYLRRALFPMHDDLRLAGVLNPLDAPHHMRASERTRFREGVVTEVLEKSCLVNVGLRRDIEVAQRIPRNTRITVEVDPSVYDSMHKRVSPGASLGVQGTAVAPTAPREQDGTYWGYATRFAASFSKVWSECTYEGGYSLSIGTSERNSESIIDPSFELPKVCFYVPLHFKRILLTILTCPPHILTFKNVHSLVFDSHRSTPSRRAASRTAARCSRCSRPQSAATLRSSVRLSSTSSHGSSSTRSARRTSNIFS